MPEPIKGTLRPLLLAELLRYLHEGERDGALVLTRGNHQSILYLWGRVLVDAVSSRAEHRLSHRLVSEGVLSVAAYDALQERLDGGAREGPALVEMGVLDPAGLWERTTAQVLDAAIEPFTWERGEYMLLPNQAPEPGRFRQKVRIVELVAEGLRRIEDRELFRDAIPSGELILEPVLEDRGPVKLSWDERARLLPHEEYVRGLLDGRRSAAEAAELSELGEFETYRTLSLLLATGHARVVLVETALPESPGTSELRRVLRDYNEIFACLYQHLLKEVGPIAVQLLEKCLREARMMNPDLLAGVAFLGDGSLEPHTLERNLRRLRPERRRDAAVGGLNEFLYAALLAVKRTLGRHHEEEAVRLLRGLRPLRQSHGA